MPYFDTFRPRGGATYSVAASGVQAVAIPSYANQVHVTATGAGGRILVSDLASAPALTATNYGYLTANIPVTCNLMQGASGDKYLHIGNSSGSALTFNITFAN